MKITTTKRFRAELNHYLNCAQEETVYIQEDSAGSTPFVAKQLNPRVEGVLVVARGGKSALVTKKISEAILALFPVEAHKITVVEMKE